MKFGGALADFRLQERRLPTKAELDAAAPRNPVYISFGAHVTVANTTALQERGITRDTPSPQGGTVVKDPSTGEPTGELRERAQFLVKRREGESDPETLAEHIAIEDDFRVGGEDDLVRRSSRSPARDCLSLGVRHARHVLVRRFAGGDSFIEIRRLDLARETGRFEQRAPPR